jgi:MIP family channel proteins
MEGLYGSQTGKNYSLAVFTELMNTYFLVLLGIGAVILASLQTSNTLVIVACAGIVFGITLLVLVNATGQISGCHANPAVTLGLWSAARFPLKYVPGYIVAQVAGAYLACLSLGSLFGPAARSVQYGITAPSIGTSYWSVFGFEIIGTFFLVLTVTAIGSDKRTSNASSGLTIGLTLALAIFLAGSHTGGGINPARVLGPMLVEHNFKAILPYIIGEIAGGVIAANLYTLILVGGLNPSEAES